eukprot:UN08443
MIYPKQPENGYNKGIHIWSVKRIATVAKCFRSIGVTTNKQTEHEHIKYWNNVGINDYWDGKGNGWNTDSTVTVILDCNAWKISYFKEKEKIKENIITANQNYYFALCSCGSRAYGVFESVKNIDVNHWLN